MQKIFIITGMQGSGKTTLIREVVQTLRKNGVRTGGIVAEGKWINSKRDSFDLVDLQTDERMVFCQRTLVDGWEKLRSFYINPDGKQFGGAALDIDHLKNAHLIVIDEIGPFELQGKGWAHPFEGIVNSLNIPLLISVREGLVEEVANKWKLKLAKVYRTGQSLPEQIVKDLMKNMDHPGIVP